MDEVQVAGTTLLSKSEITMTKEVAEWLCSMNEIKGERPFREQHVNHLSGEMIKGLFQAEQANLMTCVCDEKYGDLPAGTEYRINGHHTSWAFIQCVEAGFTPTFTIDMLKYRAATVADMKALYARTDAGAPRTKGHRTFVQVNDYRDYVTFSKNTIDLVSAAIPVWFANSDGIKTNLTSEQIVRIMNSTHYDLCVSVCRIITQCGVHRTGHKMIGRAPVVAAMLATAAVAATEAVEFWTGMANGIGFRDGGDPRLILRDHLSEHSLSAGRSSLKSGKDIVMAESMYRWCLYAWNAWRRGKQLKQLRVDSKNTRPEVV